MSRFRFRLETLRRLREIHRDELRGRLAEAFAAQQILDERRAQARSQQAALLDLRRRMLRSGHPDVNQLLEMQRFELALQSQLAALDKQAEQLEHEVQQRRQAVVEADRQVRVLDKLHDKQQLDHRLAVQAEEIKLLDEIASHLRGAESPQTL